MKRLFVLASLTITTLHAIPAAAFDRQECIDSAERGQKLRDERKLMEARDQFVSCSRPECPPIVAKDCTSWVERTAGEIPKLVARAKDENGRDLVAVRLFVDGKVTAEQLDGRRIPMNPGAHGVRFEAEGREPHEETIVVSEGEVRSLMVQLAPTKVVAAGPPQAPPPAPKPASHGPPVATYVLGAIGVVGLASFGYFALTGTNDANQLRDGCSRTATCKQSDVDDVKTKYLIADVSLAVGVVAIGAAITLWVLAPSKPTTTGIRVLPGGVAGTF